MRYIIGCKITDKILNEKTEYILTCEEAFINKEYKKPCYAYLFEDINIVNEYIKVLKHEFSRHNWREYDNVKVLCEEKDAYKKCLTIDFFPIKVDSSKCPVKISDVKQVANLYRPYAMRKHKVAHGMRLNTAEIKFN